MLKTFPRGLKQPLEIIVAFGHQKDLNNIWWEAKLFTIKIEGFFIKKHFVLRVLLVGGKEITFH